MKDCFLSPRELAEFLGVSRSTLWRMRRRGDLFEPTRLSVGRVGWRLSEIEDWIRSKQDAWGGKTDA